MPGIERFDILVIGSGEAGKHLTWSMAQSGHRTAVMERKYIGGSCPNIACLPSKNVISNCGRMAWRNECGRKQKRFRCQRQHDVGQLAEYWISSQLIEGVQIQVPR
jgi:pyruvate/2-oxoglutarate dehydrogenase complex dihydrolipoamide dehydrogenase (E3) component